MFDETTLRRLSGPPEQSERDLVINTHQQIRRCIEEWLDLDNVMEAFGFLEKPELNIFLQGSYANHTNISRSSDVDLVVMIKNKWIAYTEELQPQEIEKYRNSVRSVGYKLKRFREDIHTILRIGLKRGISANNKCLSIKGIPGLCDADVIPSFTYRKYGTTLNELREGIIFETANGQRIVNFPVQHKEALQLKSEQTNGLYKAMVRLFKNLRNIAAERGLFDEKDAKSYFIENLLFNVPNQVFQGSHGQCFKDLLEALEELLRSAGSSKMKCANGMNHLFEAGQWREEKAVRYLLALIELNKQT